MTIFEEWGDGGGESEFGEIQKVISRLNFIEKLIIN